MKFFSYRDRPVHLGPFPLEALARTGAAPDLPSLPPMTPLSFAPDDPRSLAHAMARFMAMFDTVRDGAVTHGPAEIPRDPVERSDHLKAAGYYFDAAMMGVARIGPGHWLEAPFRNPGIKGIRAELEQGQPKSFAAGIDAIYADVLDAARAAPAPAHHHTHAVVVMVDHARDPDPDEPGTDWIADTQAERAALLAANTAVVLASYLRMLGHEARAHSATTSDIDLPRLAASSGLAGIEDGVAVNPFLGQRYGLAAVTTTLELAPDRPLAHGLGRAWGDPARVRTGHEPRRRPPMAGRPYNLGPHPFETLTRVDQPTTFIDEPRVPRFPKRADFFARALFGDMGPGVQEAAKGGHYVMKSPIGACARRALGALLLLQFGEARGSVDETAADAGRNADNLKGAAYYLSADAVGLSRVPEWAWYSHDAGGNPIPPYHANGVSLLLDQGHETMEGASGDDWISVAQSMRAYLRFSLLGGVLAQQIRNLGYSAKAHTVLDGEVLQPPLLLLAGLGEVSRIGEVILNPFLGPRLKSGVVTTDMPLAHDKPIDFGLQTFCESCNKCARECPSGAITAGPKRMFNGYEIWKSDSQKCATYRITTEGGAMCGRCMKTCPWNLQGLFAEAPFRWAAMHLPKAAPLLTKLDDAAGRGGLNPVKKWWWDLELQENGSYAPTNHPVNARDLQKDLNLKYEDQTLAVYPAPLAPHPYPYPDPMDREAGIAAYTAMVSADEHKTRLAHGDTSHLHRPKDATESPVVPVIVSKVEKMSPSVTKYEFRHVDGHDLPEWSAGGHLDLVVAPEFLRQYSMSGNPANRSAYQIGVLREDSGRGGSALLHRIFAEGRRVFVSKPINHFPLVEVASFTWLMGGGIGVTPMIAMAHRPHALGRPFALHYSLPSRARAGYLDDLAEVPWADKVQIHVSDEGTRADLEALLPDYSDGQHIYTCGPDLYMNAVMEAADRKGFPEESRHLEYFAVPELPDYENHRFTLKLSDGRSFPVPADKTATDVLNENGVTVDVKCSDGICGVCKARVLSGDVEHRDFVLSKAQREDQIILCQSRAKDPDGEITIAL